MLDLVCVDFAVIVVLLFGCSPFCCPFISSYGASAFVSRRRSSDMRPVTTVLDALCFTCIEKTNTFEIDEIQFFQIQNDWRFAALDFGFDLIQVPKSKFAAKPNPPLDLFNPQRHLLIGSGTDPHRARHGPLLTACIDRAYLEM